MDFFSLVRVLLYTYRLDTLVTVIDGYNFMKDFGSGESLRDRKMAADRGDNRDIVNLLTDQVEFANGTRTHSFRSTHRTCTTHIVSMSFRRVCSDRAEQDGLAVCG